MSVGITSSEASLCGSKMTIFLLLLHVIILLCIYTLGISLWILFPLPIRTPVRLDKAQPKDLTLIYFLKDPTPNAVTLWITGDLNFNRWIWKGHKSAQNNDYISDMSRFPRELVVSWVFSNPSYQSKMLSTAGLIFFSGFW